MHSRTIDGRLWILLAAVLWSLSGIWTKSLPDEGTTIAVWRSFFAGAVLAPLARRRGPKAISSRYFLIAAVFASMIGLYIGAIKNTTAANAIFLQCSATAWVVPLGWILLNERSDGRTLAGVALAVIGIVWILSPEIVGDGTTGHRLGIMLGLGSGAAYASVIIGLRACRADNSVWLSCWNNMAGALILAAILIAFGIDVRPYRSSVLSLAVFGTMQMALPYTFFARGLQSVSPAQATLVTLVEPILNPIWVWIGHGERPHKATVIGGGIMLMGVLVANFRKSTRYSEATTQNSSVTSDSA